MTVWITTFSFLWIIWNEKGDKVLAFPGNWCHNESIRQRTTFKGEQISYTEFKKFETQLNQWKLTAGYRNTRKNKTGGTTLPLLGENTSNDWHLSSAPFNFYQEFKKKMLKSWKEKLTSGSISWNFFSHSCKSSNSPLILLLFLWTMFDFHWLNCVLNNLNSV